MKMHRHAMTLALMATMTFGGFAARAADPASGAAKVPVFRLHGPLLESPPAMDFGFDGELRQTLHGLSEKLRKASKDDAVKAVVLQFDEPQLGWGQMQELRQVIADVRASGKDVYCYLEDASAGTYLLATAASRIALAPIGGIDLVGLHVEGIYFKSLMDKIGVSADIIHIGAFKSAGEPFTRTGPSEEAAKMTDWLVEDLYRQMIDTVAEARSLSTDDVRKLIDGGPYTATEALKAKLVDEVTYVESFSSTLKQRFGNDLVFDTNYGARKGPEVDFSSPFAIFKLFGEAMKQAKGEVKPAIAVVYVDGMIVTGKTEESLFGDSGTVGSTTIRRVLNQARDDDSIKAVVLRVDSPGGSALASDIMWHAAQEVADRKPLVVSMGNVAASGGYYVSAGAEAIFAEPGTITGSIGVVGGKLVTTGLWDWLGVTFHETKRGKNASLFSSLRPFDEQERARVRGQMEEIYGEFKDRVSRGRGKQLKAKGKTLEELAGGRVYTGKQALEIGLVDHLGGLQEAVKFAARQAKAGDYEVRLLPKPENFIDLLVRSLTGETDEDGGRLRLSGQPAGWSTDQAGLREALSALGSLDPARARAVWRSLLRIELLGRERVLLTLPQELLIR